MPEMGRMDCKCFAILAKMLQKMSMRGILRMSFALHKGAGKTDYLI